MKMTRKTEGENEDVKEDNIFNQLPVDLNAVNCNLKILKFFSAHDAVLSVLFFIIFLLADFKASLIILSIPYIDFLWSFSTSKRLPKNYKKDLHDVFPSHRYVIYRLTKGASAQAISLPFLRMVLIPRSEYIQLSPDENDDLRRIGIIAHELGHLKQRDRFVFLILVSTLFAILLSFSLRVLPYTRDWFESNALNEAHVSHFVLLFFVVLGLLSILSTISRLIHRRELIADLEGFKLSPCGIELFLNGLVKIHQTSKNARDSFWNTLTHPKANQRQELLSHILPTTKFHARSISFEWALISGIFTLILFSSLSEQLPFILLDHPEYGVLFLIGFPMIMLSIFVPAIEETKTILQEYLFGVLYAAFAFFCFVYLMALVDEPQILSKENSLKGTMLGLFFVGFFLILIGFFSWLILSHRGQNDEKTGMPLIIGNVLRFFMVMALINAAFLLAPVLLVLTLGEEGYADIFSEKISRGFSVVVSLIVLYRFKIIEFALGKAYRAFDNSLKRIVFSLVSIILFMGTAGVLVNALLLPVRKSEEFMRYFLTPNISSIAQHLLVPVFFLTVNYIVLTRLVKSSLFEDKN